MKVYIVTSGEYSDYGINAVFLTYEQAVKYIETHLSEFWGYGYIEEYEVNQAAPKADKLMWKVWYKNNLWGVRQINAMRDEEPELEYDRRYGGDVYPYDRFYMMTFAKDKIHALKIAQDTYAKMKAEREGL